MRYPMDEKARARLRQAQQQEAEALAAVATAARKLRQVQDKMASAMARHQEAVDAAELSVASAQKHLVSVSGLERSSTSARPVTVLVAVRDPERRVRRRRLSRSVGDLSAPWTGCHA